MYTIRFHSCYSTIQQQYYIVYQCIIVSCHMCNFYIYIISIRDARDDGVFHTYLRVVYLICVFYMFAGRRAVDSSWHQRVRLKYRPFIVSLHTTLVNEKIKINKLQIALFAAERNLCAVHYEMSGELPISCTNALKQCSTYRTTYIISSPCFSFIIFIVIINFMFYNFVQSSQRFSYTCNNIIIPLANI